jgi:hypothetical protein
MKKFWSVLGNAYLFFHQRKRVMTPLLLVLVLMIQFVLLIWVVVAVNQVQTEVETYKSTNSRLMNRTYSQVYLMNNRLNQVLTEKK